MIIFHNQSVFSFYSKSLRISVVLSNRLPEENFLKFLQNFAAFGGARVLRSSNLKIAPDSRTGRISQSTIFAGFTGQMNMTPGRISENYNLF